MRPAHFPFSLIVCSAIATLIFACAGNGAVYVAPHGSVSRQTKLYTPGDKLAFIPSYGGGVSIFDTATNMLVTSVGGAKSIGVAVTDTSAYITEPAPGSRGVEVIDASSLSVIDTIPTGPGSFPEPIVVKRHRR